MTSHASFLELAAAAIDFPLSPADRARLEHHLDGCTTCARSAGAFRADAEQIARTRVPRLPEMRGDEILQAVLRPGGLEQPVRLLIAIALLSLLMVGAAVAGANLLHHDADPLVVVPSTPVETPSPHPGETATPVPSAPAMPAAGQLAVTRGDGAGPTWIEIVDLGTGAVRRIGDGSDAAWMGRSQLAYACSKVGGDFTGVCFTDVIDPVPSTVVPDAGHPVPAPDNRRLVLHRGMVDVGETWGVLPNGNELALISAGSFLRWSPDGSTLLGQPEGAVAQVAVVRSDGTGLRVLATGYEPAWAPDGASVAFAVADASGTSLRVVDVASGATVLRYQVPTPREIHAPAWLPGGGIVFVLDGNLWRLDAASSVPVPLTEGLAITPDATSGEPVVSPDGASVAFVTGTGADARVGTASVTGGWAMLDLPAGPITQPAWAPGPATIGAVGGSAVLGDAWTEADLPTTPGVVNAVAVGDRGFVAVGIACTTLPGGDVDDCEGLVWTSRDGRSWERAPKQDATSIGRVITTSGPSIGMLDVAVGTPGIVVVGYAARPNLLPAAWFSADGVTWSRGNLDTSLQRRVDAVTWDGTRFVAVGEDRDGADSAASIKTAHSRAAVWTSSDGQTWTRIQDSALAAGGLVDTLEDPTAGGMADVASGSRGLVGIGSTCVVGGKTYEAPWTAPCTGAVWLSADGSVWERGQLPAKAGALRSVTATSSGFVAIDSATVYTSADGRTWAAAANPSASGLKSVSVVGGRLFLTAEQGASGAPKLWVSDDGRTWSPGTVQGGVAPIEPGPDSSYWHFASNETTAVWLALGDTSHGSLAWYSTATP